jgi:hypothetical protein
MPNNPYVVVFLPKIGMFVPLSFHTKPQSQGKKKTSHGEQAPAVGTLTSLSEAS